MMSTLNSFLPISLEEIGKIDFMSRMNIKYVIPKTLLPSLLEMLGDDFYVQEISGKRSFLYQSLYYDTVDYAMYNTHQNGKLDRFKIRTREYLDTQSCFLEIKHKSNKGLTQKIRIENETLHLIEQKENKEFINSYSPYLFTTLEAKLKTSYHRIILLNKEKTERITIDYDLYFRNADTGNKVELPQLSIVEIKKKPYITSFTAIKMRESHINPYRISKYCLGASLTDSGIKQNRIKQKIRYITKITDFIYE